MSKRNNNMINAKKNRQTNKQPNKTVKQTVATDSVISNNPCVQF